MITTLDGRHRFLTGVAAAMSLFLLLRAVSAVEQTAAPATPKVSEFGKYEGYSTKSYDSYVRTSRYLEMRDGVKLAVDILRPANGGIAAEKPLPCVWTHTRYRRATKDADGNVRCAADSSFTFSLIEHGYNIVVVDVRGSGASFGTWKGIFMPEEAQDAYEITEWIASQDWCDGKIGMTGGSYLGITQLMAASKKPPHLKALFPIVALFDLFETTYHGGVFFDDFVRTWSDLTEQLDIKLIGVGVDDDPNSRLLDQAIDEHRSNRALVDVLAPLRFRDSKDPDTGDYPYRVWHPAGFVDEINSSGIPIYLWCGWFDAFTKDGFVMHRAFTAPSKITMGAWSHAPRNAAVLREMIPLGINEQLRWFDYWLKDIDNGILSEPPVSYHTVLSPGDHEWRTSSQWPISESKPTEFFFHTGPSESVDSCNDGVLSLELAKGNSARDDYVVDYTTTSGRTSRWDNAVGGGFGYPDMTANDSKSLTYTSMPLTDAIEVTGNPVVHLFAASTATDGDFFVFLEEVDTDGHSHYVTEGTLRASYRRLNPHPIESYGLPWHRGEQQDVEKLVPGKPVELVIDLHPTSTLFDKGHRIRLTIACADKDNAATPKLTPPPTVSVYRNESLPSRLVLPVVAQTAGG